MQGGERRGRVEEMQGGRVGWGVGCRVGRRVLHDVSKLWRRIVMIIISPKGILKIYQTQSFALLEKGRN